MRSAPPLLLACLLLLPCSCTSAPPLPPDDPALASTVPARPLPAADAATLEARLLPQPNDLQSRIDLLWFYRGRFADPEAERKANGHVLWLIEHHPRAAVLATPAA